LSIAIDIVLVLIVAFSAWRGCKNGFIRGVFGVVAIILAIIGAGFIAKTYSSHFTGILEPFVSGIVDKAVTDVRNIGSEPEKQTGTQNNDNTKSVYDISYSALRNIGISDGASQLIAEKVGGTIDTAGQQMSANLTSTLSSALAYIAVFAVAFILIAIILAVIGNLLKLAFSIPVIDKSDKLIGLILGIIKGLLIILTLAVVIRYVGLIPAETVEKTTILKYILNINPLANILGI